MKFYEKQIDRFALSSYWGYKRGENDSPNVKVRSGKEEYHLSNRLEGYEELARRLNEAFDGQRAVKIGFIKKFGRNYLNSVEICP